MQYGERSQVSGEANPPVSRIGSGSLESVGSVLRHSAGCPTLTVGTLLDASHSPSQSEREATCPINWKLPSAQSSGQPKRLAIRRFFPSLQTGHTLALRPMFRTTTCSGNCASSNCSGEASGHRSSRHSTGQRGIGSHAPIRQYPSGSVRPYYPFGVSDNREGYPDCHCRWYSDAGSLPHCGWRIQLHNGRRIYGLLHGLL